MRKNRNKKKTPFLTFFQMNLNYVGRRFLYAHLKAIGVTIVVSITMVTTAP